MSKEQDFYDQFFCFKPIRKKVAFSVSSSIGLDAPADDTPADHCIVELITLQKD
jgi:hypothetical protein